MVNEVQNAVLLQAVYYGITMIIMLLVVGFFQRGLFWKYVRVRMSFGKLLMVKLKTVLRDHFAVGRVEDGFLIFKLRGETLRLSIDDADAIYRCVAINWVDVDEQKNAIMRANYVAVSGFDGRKYDNLIVRALTRPIIGDMRERIMIILLVVAILASLGALVVSFQNYDALGKIGPVIAEAVKNGISNTQGVISAN